MTESDEGPILTDEHFHSHLRHRMEQRGIMEDEVRETVQRGWKSGDAKPGTQGRTLIFAHEAPWCRTKRFFSGEVILTGRRRQAPGAETLGTERPEQREEVVLDWK